MSELAGSRIVGKPYLGITSYLPVTRPQLEPRKPNREHPANAGRTSDYLVAFD